MIPLNQEQRLGRTAYFYLVSKRTNAGFAIVVVGIVLFLARAGIANLLAQPIALAGIAQPAALSASILMWASAVLIILGLVACLFGVIIARMEYANYTFTFEEFDMRLMRGILTITQVSIPYRSMQDINVERNLAHRFTKTSRVIIDSAGHEDDEERNQTDILLDPIDMAAAEDIRVMLQRKIGVQIVKTEVQADTQAGVAPAA